MWLRCRCVFRDGCSGGLAALCQHFGDWCVSGDKVCPPTRATFELLMCDEGLHLVGGMIHGLILADDRKEIDAARQIVPLGTFRSTRAGC